APTRPQVFERYVERMLTRRDVSKYASREQTLRWLTFLAKRMQQSNQTVFYLELLQPDWLTDRGRRLLYRLSGGLLVGLLGGLLVVLLCGLLGGLFFALLFGLVWMLTGLSTEQLDERMRLSSLQGLWRWLRNGLLVGLLVGLLGGLLFALLGGLLIGLVFGL